MLTLQDCMEFSDLSGNEIEAIAEHEHLSEMAAAATGYRLARSAEGLATIRRYILDDVESAIASGNDKLARHWQLVYQQFVATHSAD